MIQVLSTKYNRHISFTLLMIFMGNIVPLYATINRAFARDEYRIHYNSGAGITTTRNSAKNNIRPGDTNAVKKEVTAKKQPVKIPGKMNIGGPSQPEMSSFKSVGTDNMVNLFTGDFSYNIPLLDVGGYPVNLFYDGGVSMEQEASWVGLGWNINPGTVSRNMRGIPDDFNGDDELKQRQEMKPNKTWGVTVTPDLELVGIKDFLNLGFDVSLGVVNFSYNNYLGPALDIGIKGGTSITLASKAGTEKNLPSNLSLGVSVGANISSRNGLTLSPNVSLTASAFKDDKKLSGGIGLSTSYNSRTGIKQLQISEQMSYNYVMSKTISRGSEKPPKTVKYGSSMGASLYSASISFTKPSYVPSIRMPLENEAYAGHFQIGGGVFGVYGSIEAEVYKQTSKAAKVNQTKKMVGYMYYENAKNNPNMVMDFTRLNDNEVTPNTSIISAPQYSYDVFSIQGEGTGGSIRLYRNDMGYVRDNSTRSTERSLSIGADIGIPGHYGANVNTVKTPTTIGEWGSGNGLRNTIGFRKREGAFENVYFRNPGEMSVVNSGQYNKIGGTDLVRFKLGGSRSAPTIEPQLEHFSKANEYISTSSVVQADQTERKKRSQVISYLKAEDADDIGLDKTINSYDPGNIAANDVLHFTPYPRIDAGNGDRKKHHISEITVIETSGKRYVYGIPVYNKLQRDYTFSVDNTGTADDLVDISTSEPETLNNNEGKDGYVQVSETPAYAHSFLLTGLLSNDYVDVTGNGITEDDLGDAVKFNYTKYDDHAWRTPHTNGTKANFAAGNMSDRKDDKGIITYGVRESWYLHSVESKSMIALFTVEGRSDGKGAASPFGGVNPNDNSLKRLQKIDLYNKADLKKNGTSGAKPIKTVWFNYSYTLCTGTPDNPGGGKLTLDGVYFTYNKKSRTQNNKYVFAYTKNNAGNPVYQLNASDKWGTYKPASANPDGIRNSWYPYPVQPATANDITTINQNAAAWSLKTILLPSGGQIEVEYESDDYGYVQNKRACAMMKLVGLGNTPNTITSKLYGYDLTGTTAAIVDYDHVFIRVPEACNTPTDVFNKYLKGITQLSFKLSVNMPGGVEYINSYATINSYGVKSGDNTCIWIRLNTVNGLSPFSLSALDYLRERLPGQAYPGYDVSDASGLQAVGEMMVGMLDAIKSAFKDPVRYLRSEGRVQTINPGTSFVRLNDPDGIKYGGGHRVHSVVLKDNWSAMSNTYTSSYGQVYNYKTTEVVDGVEKEISSGVASYEPSIGSEENPFQNIIQITDKVPLGPASYGAIEMPVLDAFFPVPLVGYSKVTVTSLDKNTPTHKSRSNIGRQVTEFYTAKDFPVYFNHTALDPGSDKQKKQVTLNVFFYKEAFSSRAISQGFIVETNDMHGKMRSQTSYAANDPKLKVNYTENFYRNTGAKGLDEKFDFIYASQGGLVQQGNMGIDVELMTDTREFSVKSNSLEIQGQLDLFPVILPFWLPFIWPVSSNSEDTYRAVTTTKVINYHSVLDNVMVINKGSAVTTKNLVYDAETGDVVISQVNNEFDKPIYSVNYPAWWAYSGMGLAYKNIGAEFTGYNFLDGKISGSFDQSLFESGDELLITTQGSANGCMGTTTSPVKLWVFDKNKTNTALTVPVKDLLFIDESGKTFSKAGTSFRIVRSGKRNYLDASVAGVNLMVNPIDAVTHKLNINSDSKVITASGMEFREKWQIDNDLLRRFSIIKNPNCTETEVEDCNGYYEKSVNPYTKGLIGNFRADRNMVFYGERAEVNPLDLTNLPVNGFLANFQPYWGFNNYNNLAPDNTNPKWVYNNQVLRYNSRGMELETKDAMGIYTAAQYGYHRTLPVAITNNAQLTEAVFEGFEDYSYNANLNGVTVNNCAQRHIGFSGIANSQIVSSDVTGFNAHSGKYMMGVNAQSSLVKQFAVSSNATYDYPLIYAGDITKMLTDIGNIIDGISTVPGNLLGSSLQDSKNYINSHTSYSGSSFNVSLNFYTGADSITGVNSGYTLGHHYFNIATSQYLKIESDGFYNVNINCNVVFPSTIVLPRPQIGLIVYTLEGNEVGRIKTNWDNGTYSSGTTLCLKTGAYKIVVNCEGVKYGTYASPGQNNYTFNYSVTNNSPSYKTLTTQNGCSYTIPIAGNSGMLNPVFTIPSNKKMLFSTWVREQCNSCAGTGYISNQVNLQYNVGGSQSVALTPSGPVIEGWQRYEGEFTAPVGATEMTMSLVNNSSNTIYFDDIRIHPFNANMKSYVYDPVSLRLMAELDENNYASFYEYDEEGGLVRTKAETKEGVKTIQETRSTKQKSITQIQP